MCYIPVVTMIDGGCNKVSLESRQWQQMLSANRQPEFVNSSNIEAASARVAQAQATRQACMDKISARVHKAGEGKKELLLDDSDSLTEEEF
jgi:hypothetical protein